MDQVSLRSLKRFSLVPLLLAAISTIVLALLEIRVSIAPPFLFPVLNTLFIFAVYSTVAYFSAGNFRRTGSLEILVFGAAVLILGTSALLAAWLSPWGGLNLVTTVHNVGALLGSVLLLIVSVFVGKSVSPGEERGRLQVVILIYGAALIFIGLLTVLTLKNLMPIFFVASGPTPLRQLVYGTASVLLAISTSWFIVLYRRSRADFLYWGCLGFTSIIMGFTAGLFIHKLSDPVSWVARLALYFSGLYLLMAGLVIRSEAQTKQIGVQELVGQFLKQSRVNYEALLETVTDAIVSIDTQGRALMWNNAAERMFGYSRHEAIGSILLDLIIPREYAGPLKDELMSLSAQDEGQRTAKTIELKARRREGEEFPVEVSLSSTSMAAGRLATSIKSAITTLVIRDISERKRAEETLQRSELSYRIVAENPYDWEFWLNPKGKFIYTSPSCERITGHGVEAYMQDPAFLRSLVHAEDLAAFDLHREQEGREEGIPQFMDFRIRHKDGSLRWIGHTCKRIVDDEGHFLGIRGSNRDITARIQAEQSLREREQKARQDLEMQVQERTRELLVEVEERKRAEEALRESEKELRDLSQELFVAQEKERREIAGELHDNVWQTLGTIKFDIENFFSRQPDGTLAASPEAASRVILSLQKAVEKIRTMQGDLWPPVLEDIGILATIRWYCREFEKNHAGISIEKEIGATEEELPAPIKIVIYRVMQEALDNVVQHSDASRVLLSLKRDPQAIQFEISDNGAGFDLERILFRTRPWVGFGLVTMRERIEHSGGSFDLQSRKGTGTTICASWLLAGPDQRKIEREPIQSKKRALDEAEEPFRAVMESISDWVYSFKVETDGTFVLDWITPGFTTLTGYRADEFRNEADFAAIFHPDDRPIARERYRYIRALMPHVSEFRFIAKGGDICWVRDSINPVNDPLHPGTIQVIGAAQNITEQKRAEEALRLNERKYATILETIQSGFWLFDMEGKLLEVNEAYARMSGYSRNELLQMYIRDLEARESHGDILRHIELVHQRGHHEFESRHRRKDGTIFDVDIHATWLNVGPGRLVVFVRDITERKRMEEELRQSEEKSRLLIKYAPTMIYEIDFRRPAFKSVNDAMCQYLGYTREEFLAMNPFDLLDNEGKAVFMDRIRRKLAGETISDSVEYRGRAKDGRELCAVLNMTFVYKDGKPEGALVVVHDITERKKSEEALRKNRQELETQVREQTSELSEMIRTLQNEIIERKHLEETLRESERQVRFFASQCLTAQESERKRIAAELHDSIAASLGAIEFNIERIAGEMERGVAPPGSLKSLVPVVGETIGEVRRIMADLRPAVLDDLGIIPAIDWLSREFEKTYSIRVEKQIELLESDVSDHLKTAIFRIIQEVTNNAAKHSKASLVSLSLGKKDGRIHLRIQDNGKGFDLNHVKKGLGLSVMRERTEFLGGSFMIESIQDEGTVICASWPLAGESD